MSTYMPKAGDITRTWYILDAESHSVELLLRLLTFFVVSTSQLTHHTLTAATM